MKSLFDDNFDEFDKELDKNIRQTFNIAAILSILWGIVLLAIAITSIYLAIKNWG